MKTSIILVLAVAVAVLALPTCEIDYGATWRDSGYGKQLFFNMEHYLRSDRSHCNATEMIIQHQILKSAWNTEAKNDQLACARMGAENITLDFAPGSLVEVPEFFVSRKTGVKSVTFRAPEGNVIFRTKHILIDVPHVRFENITFVFEEDHLGHYPHRLEIGGYECATSVSVIGCRFIGSATDSVLYICQDTDTSPTMDLRGNGFDTWSPVGIRFETSPRHEWTELHEMIHSRPRAIINLTDFDFGGEEEAVPLEGNTAEQPSTQVCEVRANATEDEEGYGTRLFRTIHDAVDRCKEIVVKHDTYEGDMYLPPH